MGATTHVEPTPAMVGAMYDQLTGPIAEALGGLHLWILGRPGKRPNLRSWQQATDRSGHRAAVSVKGQHVLDIGCGVGKPAADIATAYNVCITGITVSNQQVELAQAQLGNGIQPGQVSVQFADAMNLPFADASFDGAYALESLCHMHDKGAVFAHAARVLRPGGRLVIADLFLDGPIDGHDSEILARCREIFQISTVPTADQYRNLLQRAGLSIIEFTNIRHNVFRSYEVAQERLREMGPSLGREVEEKLHNCASVLGQLSSIKHLSYALITAARD